MADWTNELALEFLELYAAEPILYDVKNPYHKNKKMNHNAWSRIQQSLSVLMPVSELRKKKDSLMASFRHQIRKKKEALSTGDGTFKPAWFAFDKMYSFLGHMYENDYGFSAEDSGPVIELVDFDTLEDISPSSNSPRPLTPQQFNKQENKFQPITQEPTFHLNPQEDMQKTILSKRKRPTEMQLEEIQPQVDGESSVSRSDEDDECDLYGRLIAKKLRKLPEAHRERLMYEIQGLFLKASQYR